MVVEENKKQNKNIEKKDKQNSQISNQTNTIKNSNVDNSKSSIQTSKNQSSKNNTNKNNNSAKNNTSYNNQNKFNPKNKNYSGKNNKNKNNQNNYNSNSNSNTKNNHTTNSNKKSSNLSDNKNINISTKERKTESIESKTKVEEKNADTKNNSEKNNTSNTSSKTKSITTKTPENIDSILEKRDINKEKKALQNEISEKEKINQENIKKDDQNNKSINNFEQSKNKNDRKTKKSKPIMKIALIIIIVLFIILISIFSIFTFKNNDPSTIAKGIYINGIDMSELTKDEAKSKLEEYYTEKISHDITLIHGEYEMYINPSEISLEYEISQAINSAFKIGKNGNIFEDDLEILNTMLNGIEITPKYTYSKDTLKTMLDNFSAELPDHVVESSYYIENNNVIITLGSSGKMVDSENTIPLVEETFADLSFTDNKIEIKTLSKDPEKINVSKIHDEIYKKATDAYYTTNPYVVHPSENGLDFKISLEEAEKLVANSTEKEIQIPLKVLYPSITTNMIGAEAFPDLLATFSTKYVSNKDRTTNLSIAAKKVNGYVLLPGETFSYNTVVGERTIAAGYKSAAVYENGQVVQGLGGGICQISTTIFNAVLFANLGIVELHNHQFVPSYVTAGRDATVVYGLKDFKFKNTRKYAIKIECTVSGGIAKCNIWGVKEPTEYDVSVYANITSRTDTYIKSATYRTLKLNGQVINTEKISNYTYKVH